MAGIYQSVTELIGRTPLLEVKNLEKELNLQARVLVKLEYFNPAGSVKDRAALQMITEAEENGTLKQGSAIIEPTSGNTGIGLASIAASRGYRAIFVMPETMSIERRKLLKGYGAEIVLTEGAKGMKGAIAKAKELEQEIENAVILGQFVNTANPRAHEKTTGPEIWEDTQGQVDLFVAGVGTGGTITGTGAYLKSVNPSIEIVAVEPASSAVLSGENPGPHGLQGIGAGFVPDVLNTSVYDRISKVKEQEAYKASRLLAEKEGVLVGISSGAALSVALLEAGKDEGLIPCGLGARDTLRMEAAMPLYGHEMDDEISPLETGLKFAVKMGKEEDFIGKKAMEERGEPKITRIGLKVTGRGIIREHQDIYVGEKKIGHTTSGTHCPFLGYPIAMALVDAGSVEIGNKVEVDVRGRKVEAEVIALPFYKRAK